MFERARPRLRGLGSGIRRWLRPRRLLGVTLVAGVLATIGIFAEAAVRARLDSPAARVPTMLYTRPSGWGNGRGRPVPIGSLAEGLAESRTPVRLDDVPAHLVQAVLAVEDQRFFEHGGLDLQRIAGAAVANIRAGGIAQGGSTITQQLAKNLFLSARRTPLRKLREAAMAVMLEDRYAKPAILEAYLNEIYLGQEETWGIHGVAAAARYYFGKELDDLTLGEAALLAGMIRAPNRYTPVRHADRARERRDLVLRLMVEQGRIDERAARRAGRERIRTRPNSQQVADARYFRDFALGRLRDEAGRVPERGAAVYTTLDPALQRAAERAVREGLAALRTREAQAALVALDPRTGEVLAMVGGRDYGASQFNRATDALRQPGSAFKPIVALAALGRQGRRDPTFTLASVVEDEPLTVTTPAGLWEPDNYDRQFRGPVTVREALEQSLNVPFARIGLAVGPERIAETGKRLGIIAPLRPVPSLALGASEVTPLELTRAYGVFATGGKLADTRTVLAVGSAAGNGISSTRAARIREVADPAEAYLVTSALEGAVARGTGRALAGSGHRDDIAGKSGTSSEWRDGWFVAYTPTLVVGVWVGYDDGRSLRLTGSRSALPIVALFLREALRQTGGERFPVPDGIEFAYVGTDRGWWGWECNGEPEVFLEGTAPDDRCGRGWRPDRWIARLEDRRDELVDELVDLLERHGDELEDVFLERAEDAIRTLAEQLAEQARRALRQH
ncbi:MAG: PBP1A family penicillin-binding protein [Gemmatimonadota bacterium]|nr:PBP1A family penicillin-binding protein [Gemmatimonadota bacterium]MDH5197257.1 PBP1A family penicillin-binding protein [Gemmatimonadota bacterium]